MATTNDDVISTLNNLVETCKDGETGFRTAAENMQSSDLKTLFNTLAQQRARFAADLQGEVRHRGGDPEKSGSVSGALHRGWMNLKSSISGKTDASIIAECESGEDSALKNYQNALKENLPTDLLEVLQRQFQEVKQSHDRIRDLKQATS